MKTALLLLTMLLCVYGAEITLTPQQEKDWSVITQKPERSAITPQSTLLIEVVTPPQLLQTVSLPNEVTVTKLHVNLYDTVKRGDALVDVSSPQWLEAQKSAISSSIEYTQALQNDKRKQSLCHEQIIAKKECITSHATLLSSKNALQAAKELLSAYGASAQTIKTVTTKFKVYPTLTITSSATGTIIQNSTAIGKSFSAFEPLMIIKKEGDLWIEGALGVQESLALHNNQRVTLKVDTKQFESKVLNIAPVINSTNQTRNVRFLLSQSLGFFTGLKTQATLYLHQESLKVPKKALIKNEDETIVFVKEKNHYRSVAVTIVAQEGDFSYLKPLKILQQPIATTSIAILKSMMERDNE
jgi:cobalt-zinc-cadmium efflux system membrane fusion protein